MADKKKNQGGSMGRGAGDTLSDKATHSPKDDQRAPNKPAAQDHHDKNSGQGRRGTGNRISDQG